MTHPKKALMLSPKTAADHVTAFNGVTFSNSEEAARKLVSPYYTTICGLTEK